MELSMTAQRALLAQEKVKLLEEIFTNAGVEFFRTGDNTSTLTFECGELGGKPVYGSIRFTLHKSNYNLDAQIEEFELLLEEKERKAKEKEQKAKDALKKKAKEEA